MKDVLTKLGIVTGLLGTLAIGATSTALAKPHHAARSVAQAPSNYSCQSSWSYPGYYCYENWSSDWSSRYYSYGWYPSYYSYGWYPSYYAYDWYRY